MLDLEEHRFIAHVMHPEIDTMCAAKLACAQIDSVHHMQSEDPVRPTCHKIFLRLTQRKSGASRLVVDRIEDRPAPAAPSASAEEFGMFFSATAPSAVDFDYCTK